MYACRPYVSTTAPASWPHEGRFSLFASFKRSALIARQQSASQLAVEPVGRLTCSYTVCDTDPVPPNTGMPPRTTAPPTRFFPADPETSDLTLPTPPIEFSLPSEGDDGGGAGGPGPSSLAHRLALAAATSYGLPVPDLHVNETAAAGPASTSRKRKVVTPSTATAAGSRKRVQKTDQVDTSAFSGGKGKGKSKRSQASAAGATKRGKASSTSTTQDIRVQPSSDVEENTSDEDAAGPRPQSKRRRQAFGNGAASDDAASSDAYTDNGSSEGGDSAAAAVESSEEEEEAEAELVRRKPGRRRRDSPSYVEPINVGPSAGGPGYEGFAATLLLGGGGGAASKPGSKVLPPVVPPLLRGSGDLKALLLASVEDDEEEEEDEGVGGFGAGMDAEGKSGGVHRHQRSPASLTTAQLAELERASDPYVWRLRSYSCSAADLFLFSPAASAFATTLLEKVAGRISALDTAYAKLSEELSKAQLEASVLGNVKSLLKVRGAHSSFSPPFGPSNDLITDPHRYRLVATLSGSRQHSCSRFPPLPRFVLASIVGLVKQQCGHSKFRLFFLAKKERQIYIKGLVV